MSECEECVRKDRLIRVMNDTLEGYKREAREWRTYHYELTDIMQKLHLVIKDAMWHPSNYKERGETGNLSSQSFIDVQTNRSK